MEYNRERLFALAQQSEEKEAFYVLDRGHCFRVGVGVRISDASIPIYFMEIILRYGQQASEVKIESLQKVLDLVNQLKNRRYRIYFQDVGSFLCERKLDSIDALEEYRAVKQFPGFPPSC
jgi:hypothetical protein